MLCEQQCRGGTAMTIRLKRAGLLIAGGCVMRQYREAKGVEPSDEDRKGRHGDDARRRSSFAMRLPAGCRWPLSGAVCDVALPIRNGRGAGLSAVPLARDRSGRM